MEIKRTNKVVSDDVLKASDATEAMGLPLSAKNVRFLLLVNKPDGKTMIALPSRYLSS